MKNKELILKLIHELKNSAMKGQRTIELPFSSEFADLLKNNKIDLKISFGYNINSYTDRNPAIYFYDLGTIVLRIPEAYDIVISSLNEKEAQ